MLRQSVRRNNTKHGSSPVWAVPVFVIAVIANIWYSGLLLVKRHTLCANFISIVQFAAQCATNPTGVIRCSNELLPNNGTKGVYTPARESHLAGHESHFDNLHYGVSFYAAKAA